MSPVDFDFRRYVEQRKGRRAFEAREGAAYAYPGDLRFLRTLEGARPVRLALDVAVRITGAVAEQKLVRVTERSHAALYGAMKTASERLRLAAIPVVVDPTAVTPMSFFGEESDVHFVLDAALARSRDEILVHLAGWVLGAIQNGHLPYETTRHHLHHSAGRFSRWLLVPARVALDGWNRRAELTRDRAGLLATRDLESSIAAIAAVAGKDTALRQDALRIFAATTYFRGIIGESNGTTIEACNAAVAERLAQ